MGMSHGLIVICVLSTWLQYSTELPSSVLKLSAPDYYPHFGQPYTLTCNVTDYARSQSISFKRDSDEFCQVYFDMKNDGTKVCQNKGNETTSYQCTCDFIDVDYILYSIRITSVRLADATRWACVSIHYGQHSNEVLINYGPDNVTITGNRLHFPADGVSPLLLTCETSVTNSHVTFTWIVINETSKARTLTSTGRVVTRSTFQGFVHTQELSIVPVWYQDESSIICSVRNKNATSFAPVTTSVKLDLMYGPEHVAITGNQRKFNANGHKSLTLFCKTSSVKGRVVFKWINATDGKPIDSKVGPILEEKLSRGTSYSQSFEIQPVWYQDGEKILCEVKNLGMSYFRPVIATTTLDLIYGPEYIQITGNQINFIADGTNSLTLTCETSAAKGNISFVWLNNTSETQLTSTAGDVQAKPLDKGFVYSQSLQISPVWYQDGDSITCQVANTDIPGSTPVTSSTKLMLVYGPNSITITGNKAGFIADGVNLLTLVCKTGITKGQMVFNWVNTTSALKITSGVGPIQTENTGDGTVISQSLQIVPVWYQDGNEILCEATNSDIPSSNPVKSSITLDLIYAPTVAPVISGYTSQSPLHEGDILNIACQVTGGKPLVSHVKFVCHGADVQGWEKRDELGVTRSIQFMVLKTHHGKVCGCSAQHVTGKYDLASMVTLVVNYAPVVTLYQESRRARQSVRIVCLAEGRPAVYQFSSFIHSWQGQRIRELAGSQESPNNYVITIHHYTYRDSGSYQCAASNGVIGLNGAKEQHGNITVSMEVPPAVVNITQHNETVETKFGERLILSKIIFSQSDITSYLWIDKAGNAVPGQIKPTRVTLNIHSSSVNDDGYIVTLVIGQFGEGHRGSYTLKVCNRYGCSQFYTYVKNEVTDEDQTPASGLIVPIVLGVAGFLMLLIIIVIATVYCCGAKRRRRRRDPSQSTDDTTSDTDEGQDEANHETNHVNRNNSKKHSRQENAMYPPPPLEPQRKLKSRPVFKDLRQLMRRSARPKKSSASDGETSRHPKPEEQHSDVTDNGGSSTRNLGNQMKSVEEINAANAVEVAGVHSAKSVNFVDDPNYMQEMNDIYALVKRKKKPNDARKRPVSGNFEDMAATESESSENERANEVRVSEL